MLDKKGRPFLCQDEPNFLILSLRHGHSSWSMPQSEEAHDGNLEH